ncbi:MAG TPA: hemagglutinin repeat-containing protein, partial [Luteibacter sp.]|nr:hemagglutinin repeat-containing protein [Luteibacter sp.]
GDAQLSAGRDLALNAIGHTQAVEGNIAKGESTTHDVTTITAGGSAVLAAGRDLVSQGADLKTANVLALSAGQDITLDAVTDRTIQQSNTLGHGIVHTQTMDETLRGSSLDGTKGVIVSAGRDLTTTAATITSDTGGIALAAGRDVNLNAGIETHTWEQTSKTKKSGALSSKTTKTYDATEDKLALGTLLSGDSVTVAAGRDLTTQAAQIGATQDVVLAAGNNLTIGIATSTHRETHDKTVTQSGLMSGGGFSVMLGQSKESQGYEQTDTTPTGSLIGSTDGRVTLSAGNDVHITGSDILSQTGTAIVGKNVTIDAALATTDSRQTYKKQSAGISLGLAGGVVDAAQAAYGNARRSGEVEDSRLKLLYAAKAASVVNDAYQATQAAAANAASGVSLRIGIGASSASSETKTHEELAYGSRIRSAGDVTIAATGGDLNIVGSEVDGKNVALAASRNINLVSQAEQHEMKSSNKNGSGEIGFSIGSQTGFYVTASAGRGKGVGNGTTHAETSVNASNSLTLVSGNDTTIKGAQLTGDQVVAAIGGNFRVESEQDTDDYASKQQQAGGTFVYGSGGSVNYSQDKVNSHYKSVNEVSGIGAGSGGFQIAVGGITHLKGGVIASSASAGHNYLSTGSLTVEDLQNEASGKASSLGLGASSDMFSGSKYDAAKGIVQNALGNDSEDEHHGSTTRSDIAAGQVIVRNGDTGVLAGLDRDVFDLSGGNTLKAIDTKSLQEQVELSRGLKDIAYTQGVKYTDEAYRTMFIEKAELYEVVKNENGELVQGRRLTESEKLHLLESSDGKVHIANNGIFNDEPGAEKYADQNGKADGPQYYLHFPEAGNGLSELLVAGYQKNLEGDFWGLANATTELKGLMLQYGQDGLQLDGHSRGSMTIGNAMDSIMNAGQQGALSNTTINFFGPAYNAAKADAMLSYLQSRETKAGAQAWVLTLQNHVSDPVGRFIGRNPVTGGTIPDGSNIVVEMLRAGTGQKNTSHNCYGHPGGKGCGAFWSDSEGAKASSYPVNWFDRNETK